MSARTSFDHTPRWHIATRLIEFESNAWRSYLEGVERTTDVVQRLQNGMEMVNEMEYAEEHVPDEGDASMVNDKKLEPHSTNNFPFFAMAIRVQLPHTTPQHIPVLPVYCSLPCTSTSRGYNDAACRALYRTLWIQHLSTTFHRGSRFSVAFLDRHYTRVAVLDDGTMVVAGTNLDLCFKAGGAASPGSTTPPDQQKHFKLFPNELATPSLSGDYDFSGQQRLDDVVVAAYGFCASW
ncbi:hypothetical protein IAT38_003164 [Cryptococcus sp. DSM 104549]